ncbi:MULTISPECIES: hypothetical protein [Myxococcus]|uniref:Lipoprotein n=1 Tax=Myxococcus llanfairpwllgwyngyllgogerychwyrndrobwllllantysiliogogogochensis TaxID=2590453 RepID=A0A540WTT7_9BACT|nr:MULTISPECIES: hypothetical protein [Myxococcus]NTX07607.1 hypothetical protein [Myxococcus sp. CA040A]TQF12418.1 hypothetical protein FJV41_29200 [Myxococcus llanfairpwllgwyngyllgogerychwyrndrobwllllantysiliogogogochensis]
MHRLLIAALLSLSLAACSDDPDPSPPTDAGADAGVPDDTDAGSDAGTDAGSDAGPGPWTDAGSSHGTGKLPCDSTGTVLSTNNQTYTFCVAQVAGIELKIVEPRAGIVPVPLNLAIYLHGDQARAHTGNTAPRLQAPWAFDHDTLYVSALAPNKCAWWTKPSLTTCTDTATAADRDVAGDNARALTEVIDTLRKRWDLNNEPILFGGSSGGSVFLTASFLPKYGGRYRGIYALGCGGEAPWSGALDWDSTRPELRGPTKLFYLYGDQDEYLPDIRASMTEYRRFAVPLEETVIAGVGHCDFDHIGGVKDIWAAALDAK